MSYICQKCKKTVESGKPAFKEVLEYRNKTYEYTDKKKQAQTSVGKEIVKEIIVCKECFDGSKKSE